ncbi:MAG TPA: MFS transporter [Steroidobacteraceae bacterium]|nr:MFS transporter [Steroidobacteraceae bacterium]
MANATDTIVHAAQARPVFYGWTLLGALWLVMCFNLGFPAYGQSVISAVMGKTLGFDRRTLGAIFAVYIAMSGVPGPLVAMSVNRFGSRRTLVLGSAILVSGALLMALWVTERWQAILSLGILVGAGVVTGAAIASQAVIARWFVRRRALALAILYSAGALGGAMAAWVLTHVIEWHGGDWRAGWWVIAMLSTLAAVIAAIFVRESPESLGQVADGQPPEPAAAKPVRRPAFVTAEEWSAPEALINPAYWLMVFSLVGGSGGYSLYLSQGIPHLIDLGHPLEVAKNSIVVMTISGLGAKAVLALLGDRIDPRYLWAVFTAFFGLGLVLIVHARSYEMLVAFSICIGVGFGGGVVSMMTVLGNYFGMRSFALLSGVAIGINTGFSVIAPWVGGYLFDKGTGYGGTFYTVAVWCFVGSAVLFVLKRPRRKAGTPQT